MAITCVPILKLKCCEGCREIRNLHTIASWKKGATENNEVATQIMKTNPPFDLFLTYEYSFKRIEISTGKRFRSSHTHCSTTDISNGLEAT